MAPIEEVAQKKASLLPPLDIGKIGAFIKKNAVSIIFGLILVGILMACIPRPNMFGNNDSDRTIPKAVFESFSEDQTGGRAGNINVTFFYVNWCGYCKEAKPHFQEFMAMNDKKVINNKNVTVKMIDCESSNENKKLAEELGVDGYPTITAQFGDRLERYNGPRTLDGLNNWLSNM